MMHPARYMAWAKSRPHSELDLALSNVPPCSLDDLPGAREAVDLAGRNDDGYLPLLEAIAGRYGVSPERVATSTGTSGANFLVALALLRPGDDVLVERPAYDPLLAVAATLGASLVRFNRPFADRHGVDPGAVADALTSATRLVVLTHPHNPSGALASDAALVEIARLVRPQEGFVLVDEVYLDAARGFPAPPAARLADNIISTNSLTKSYGLASLRCGWAIAAAPIAERIRRARDLVDGAGAVPAERLAVVAFQHLESLAARARAVLEPNVRAYTAFLDQASQLEGFVEYGTVAFPRLRGVTDATSFLTRLFEDTGTALVPGSFFEAPSHFRIGLGVPTETFATGLERLGRALKALS